MKPKRCVKYSIHFESALTFLYGRGGAGNIDSQILEAWINFEFNKHLLLAHETKFWEVKKLTLCWYEFLLAHFITEQNAMPRRENKLCIKRLTPAKPITFALTSAVQKLTCFDWLLTFLVAIQKNLGCLTTNYRSARILVWQLFYGLHLALSIFETAPMGSNFTAAVRT